MYVYVAYYKRQYNVWITFIKNFYPHFSLTPHTLHVKVTMCFVMWIYWIKYIFPFSNQKEERWQRQQMHRVKDCLSQSFLEERTFSSQE